MQFLMYHNNNNNNDNNNNNNNNMRAENHRLWANPKLNVGNCLKWTKNHTLYSIKFLKFPER